MSVDLIIYGVVAAGLIVWLRGILGTRHGDERQPPNVRLSEDGKIVNLDQIRQGTVKQEKTVTAADSILELFENPTDTSSIEHDAKDGLLSIAQADKSFDIHDFLDKTQDVFAIVVEAFAEGDRDTLKNLLTSNVYEPFDQAIQKREDSGETMATDIHAVRKADVLEASLEKNKALITVKFTAEETSVSHDKDGNIIAGHPDKISEIKDIWVFSRDLKSSDPRWWLCETRGDFDGDNETIPDSEPQTT